MDEAMILMRSANPAELEILERFRVRVGPNGDGMPFGSLRENTGIPAAVSAAGAWRESLRMFGGVAQLGTTYGETLHLARSCDFYQSDRDLLAHQLFPIDDGLPLQRTGFIAYRPGSGMGWHTNANRPGRRFYFTYTESGGRFRWAMGDVEHCLDEPPGWHLKTFTIPKPGEPEFRHAIEAPSFRISIGFRLDIPL